jgi:hypothetical protein
MKNAGMKVNLILRGAGSEEDIRGEGKFARENDAVGLPARGRLVCLGPPSLFARGTITMSGTETSATV